MEVEVGTVVAEVEEKLTGGAVGIAAKFGHGNRSVEVGIAGLVGNRALALDGARSPLAVEPIGQGETTALQHEILREAMHEAAVVGAVIHIGQKILGCARRQHLGCTGDVIELQIQQSVVDGTVGLELHHRAQHRVDVELADGEERSGVEKPDSCFGETQR